MTKPKVDADGNRVPRGKYFAEIGQVFGRWVVVDATRIEGNGDVKALCCCECGVERAVSLAKLNKGESKSCGCLAADLSADRGTTHGGSYTLEYGIWRGMLKRCNDPRHDMYPRYGGRGITVCDRWSKFENFIEDMGFRPSLLLSIERRDNDGPYAPWNCYWATDLEQNNNTSGCRPVEFNGRVQTLAAWGREFGISRATLAQRLSRGWTLEDALTIPVGTIENIRNGGYKLLKQKQQEVSHGN